MKLAGKVAVVTGSSQGIGQGVVLRLSQEGANMVIKLSDVDYVTDTNFFVDGGLLWNYQEQ